ncbi:MAG: hypothetical protein BWY70_00121 [Bacteroidetes bacterium ADurb.Bin408]|nr:MAG: hypothetical protein BWY70_00121 [Bacteroidetes bacterium ADurb.Bin408]
MHTDLTFFTNAPDCSLLYHLYDLSYEEARIIDTELELSEEEYSNFKIE